VCKEAGAWTTLLDIVATYNFIGYLKLVVQEVLSLECYNSSDDNTYTLLINDVSKAPIIR
jgi:hypothetical protein